MDDASSFPRKIGRGFSERVALGMLDRMWMDEGYFCREPGLHEVKFAFTNYGVSVGLQAVNAMPERVPTAQRVFRSVSLGR